MNSEDLEFVGPIKSQRLTSLDEDFKAWRSEIRDAQIRWVKYGTNSVKKAALISKDLQIEWIRERFPEENQADS